MYFEWYVARIAVNNGHQEDICYDEIELSGSNCRRHSKFNNEHD